MMKFLFRNRLTIIAILSLTLTACKEEGDMYESPCSEDCSLEWQLEGIWHWESTLGPFHQDYAMHVDYTETIIISGDVWREYYNDSLTKESIFEFQANPNSASSGHVIFDNRPPRSISLYRCNLILEGVFSDGPDSYYCKE